MKESRKYHSPSIYFKLRVFQEYYESGMSKHGLGRKYYLAPACIRTRLRQFESGSLSLPPDLNELERQVYMARKKNMSRTEVSSADPEKTPHDELQPHVLQVREPGQGDEADGRQPTAQPAKLFS